MEIHNPDCGCAITTTYGYGNLSYVIAFCPLHVAARELLEAAKEIMAEERQLRPSYLIFSKLEAAIQKATNQVAKAKGATP